MGGAGTASDFGVDGVGPGMCVQQSELSAVLVQSHVGVSLSQAGLL